MDMSLDDIVRMECITVPPEYQSIPRGGGGRGRGASFRGTATYFRRGGYRGSGHPRGRPPTSVSSFALDRFHAKRLNTRYGPRGGNSSHGDGASHRGSSSFYSRGDRGFHRPLLNRPPYTGGFQHGGTVLSVGNLEQGVDEEDIRQLFSVYGQLNHWKLYTNQGGKGQGRAKVIFSHRNEAMKAIQHLDAVTLDGRPMCIQMDESSRMHKHLPNMNQGRGGGNMGQGPSQGLQDQPVTAEELNRELDEWRMQVDNEETAI